MDQLFVFHHHLLRRAPMLEPEKLCDVLWTVFQFLQPATTNVQSRPWVRGMNSWSLKVIQATDCQVSAC